MTILYITDPKTGQLIPIDTDNPSGTINIIDQNTGHFVEIECGESYGSTVLSRTVTLVDSQIRLLHTIGQDIIPAPGVGKMISPISIIIIGHQTIPYSNIASDANFSFMLNGFGVYALGNVNPLLTFGADSILPPSPANISIPGSTSAVDVISTFENQPLVMILNNTLGSPQDGDAGNTIDITILYAIIDL